MLLFTLIFFSVIPGQRFPTSDGLETVHLFGASRQEPAGMKIQDRCALERDLTEALALYADFPNLALCSRLYPLCMTASETGKRIRAHLKPAMQVLGCEKGLLL